MTVPLLRCSYCTAAWIEEPQFEKITKISYSNNASLVSGFVSEGGGMRYELPKTRTRAEVFVKETGLRNSAQGADKFGFKDLDAIHWNLDPPQLYEHSVVRCEATIVQGGP